jgi:fluoride exporter
MLQKLLLLGAAGACGTLARYGLITVTQRAIGGEFPWGTFAANMAGCFIAGLLWILFERSISISGETRIIIFAGFFGAFTTFSTLMLETGEMFRDAQWFCAIKNLALHNGFGLLSLFAGLTLGRLMKGV